VIGSAVGGMAFVGGDLLLVLHLLGTFGMTGLIWFVQVVHYPMLARFPVPDFGETARIHCDRTGFVVAPLMLGEAATGVLLWMSGLRTPLFTASLWVLFGIWASTFVVQVPLHRRLLAGWDPAAAARLTGTNWIRTAGWTARTTCLVLLFS